MYKYLLLWCFIIKLEITIQVKILTDFATCSW